MSAPHLLFDHAAITHRRTRAFGHEGADFLLSRIAEDMQDRLAPVLRDFTLIADLATPSEHLRLMLEERGYPRAIALEPSIPLALHRTGPVIAAHEEALPLRPGHFDLIVSGMALHQVNDLPGTLLQVRQALKPDGLFMAAFLGGDTLTELRQCFIAAETELTGGISPRVAPFVDVRDLGALLQRAGFALPVTDCDRITVRYDSVFQLMGDLRAMGLTNALMERRRTFTSRQLLGMVADLYAERFSDPDGRIRASFDLVWLSGWAPHESQQKPLRPGSAKTRLADALKVEEQKLTPDRE